MLSCGFISSSRFFGPALLLTGSFPQASRRFITAMPTFKDQIQVTEKVHDFIQEKGFHESDVAARLRVETDKQPRRIMLGDPVGGALFGSIILPAIGAKKVLEVGVFTGYTTLIMATALPADGKIVALDIDDDFCSVGKPYWKEAGVDGKIDLQIGPAVESMQKLIDDGQENTFDFCFIDANKSDYPNYYEAALKLLRPNGIIAIDNTLWKGRVVDETVNDVDTVALREMADIVMKDDRVEHTLLPFADGLTLVRKK